MHHLTRSVILLLTLCVFLGSCNARPNAPIPDTDTVSTAPEKTLGGENNTDVEPTGTFPISLNDPEKHVIATVLSFPDLPGDVRVVTLRKDYIPGTVFTFYTHIICDADLGLYANGRFCGFGKEATLDGESVWEYTYVMTSEATTLEFRIHTLDDPSSAA